MPRPLPADVRAEPEPAVPERQAEHPTHRWRLRWRDQPLSTSWRLRWRDDGPADCDSIGRHPLVG